MRRRRRQRSPRDSDEVRCQCNSRRIGWQCCQRYLSQRTSPRKRSACSPPFTAYTPTIGSGRPSIDQLRRRTTADTLRTGIRATVPAINGNFVSFEMFGRQGDQPPSCFTGSVSPARRKAAIPQQRRGGSLPRFSPGTNLEESVVRWLARCRGRRNSRLRRLFPLTTQPGPSLGGDGPKQL